jgi:wyosine [tRNA(Phe)-imidazoG37] synthetase (radical SAM superfamily)
VPAHRDPGRSDPAPDLRGLRRLFSDRADQHRWRAPQGHDFDGALAEFGPLPRTPAVVVVPTRHTFWRLAEVCAFAAAQRGVPLDLPPFELSPLGSIWDRLVERAAALDAACAPAGVVVRFEDPDLEPLLRRLQHATHLPERELLQALGALCDHDFVGPVRDKLVDPLHRFDERVMHTLHRSALIEVIAPGPRAELQDALLPDAAAPLSWKVAGLLGPRSDAVEPPPWTGEPIAVARSSWYSLAEQARGFFERAGRACPALPELPLRPLPGLAARLVEQARQLNELLAPLGTGFDLGAAPVLPMLRAFEDGLQGFDPRRERTLLRLLGIASEHAFVWPQTVHVDVIAACQHRCTFCYTYTPLIGRKKLRELGRGTGGRLDWDLYLSILDDLQRMDSVDDLLFNGPGEPMLHPRMMDMIAEAKRRGFTTTLFTNGLMLTAANARRLIELECDRVYWSMHACTPRSYQAVHPGRPDSEFDLQVAQGTELMRLRNESGGAQPQVFLVNVLGAETWDEAVATAELGRAIGVDHIRLQLTLSHDADTDAMAATDEQVAQIRAALPQARRICEEAGIHLLENLDIQLDGRPEQAPDDDFENCDWSYQRYVRSGCHVGWLFSRIWVDGTISFCCHPKVVDDVTLERGYAATYFGERYDRIRNVAARWDEAHNVDMHKTYEGGVTKGALLFDKACDHCGNYEHMDLVQREVGGLGALVHLPRTVAACRDGSSDG